MSEWKCLCGIYHTCAVAFPYNWDFFVHWFIHWFFSCNSSQPPSFQFLKCMPQLSILLAVPVNFLLCFHLLLQLMYNFILSILALLVSCYSYFRWFLVYVYLVQGCPIFELIVVLKNYHALLMNLYLQHFRSSIFASLILLVVWGFSVWLLPYVKLLDL